MEKNKNIDFFETGNPISVLNPKFSLEQPIQTMAFGKIRPNKCRGADDRAMQFIADFHIHSKYSRATSKNLDFENLYIQAQIKGINVLGTGDFTHPGWWQDINEKLTYSETGLFCLKEDIAEICDRKVPPNCRRPVRFMLVTEISNIYKKDGRTRKNHNLVFFPNLETAAKLRFKLDRIGNIRSDGRPILGLDTRDLLEIILETSSQAYLIPAHIWTPWFSLLGSQSGFDSVADCFGDLTEYIFALETGLSSDPAMNRRVSKLDGFTLISNSDAHSPSKLGREANWFDTELSFPAIRESIQSADPDRFLGTFEFFPEEGKYHFDGHRKCAFRSAPHETKKLNNICPVCQKSLTLGVLNRVEELADRKTAISPPKGAPYYKLIPLESILAEIYQCGVATNRVQKSYFQLIDRFGAEFDILLKIPPEEIDRKSAVPFLSEAITRMRNDRIHFEAGFDGEFGRMTIFSPVERHTLSGQANLFDAIQTTTKESFQPLIQIKPLPARSHPSRAVDQQKDSAQSAEIDDCNPEQQAVINHSHGPLIITAGPGTGKTHIITHRMAGLIKSGRVPPENVLAVTFTNKAALEMKQRLTLLLGDCAADVWITTFHGLCLRLLHTFSSRPPTTILDASLRYAYMADTIDHLKRSGFQPNHSADYFLDKVIQAKQRLLGPQDDLGVIVGEGDDGIAEYRRVYQSYQNLLESQAAVDFEDLIFQCVQKLERDPQYRFSIQRQFHSIFVDEFQDINHSQYRLIRLLAAQSADVCVIGDPDQAIYGFRGSDAKYFEYFSKNFTGAKQINLIRNYRSTETILKTSFQVIRAAGFSRKPGAQSRLYSNIKGFNKISILAAPTARSEAVQIGCTIEQMVGGSGFHADDFGKLQDRSSQCSFADFAVLFRTVEQGRFIESVLSKAGIPCQLADRNTWLQQGAVARLIAIMRVCAQQGTVADLVYLSEALPAAPGRETLSIFKSWVYPKKLTLEQAFNLALRLPIPDMSSAQQKQLVNLIRALEELRRNTQKMHPAKAAAYIIDHTRLATNADKASLLRFLELASIASNQNGAFINELALNKDADFYREGVEKVALMSMHASKGLEFPVVLIAGCEDGLIPLRHPGCPATDIEEERRLFYVAMTRAKERLIFSWSMKRKYFGRNEPCKLSPFVEDIEQRYKEHCLADLRKGSHRQLRLF